MYYVTNYTKALIHGTKGKQIHDDDDDDANQMLHEWMTV